MEPSPRFFLYGSISVSPAQLWSVPEVVEFQLWLNWLEILGSPNFSARGQIGEDETLANLLRRKKKYFWDLLEEERVKHLYIVRLRVGSPPDGHRELQAPQDGPSLKDHLPLSRGVSLEDTEEGKGGLAPCFPPTWDYFHPYSMCLSDSGLLKP